MPRLGPALRERPDLAADFMQLRDLGAFDVISPGVPIDAATDAELDAARDRVSPFVDMLPIAVTAIEAMYGRDVAGLGLFRLAGQRATASFRAFVVRYGLLLPQLAEEKALNELVAALAANNPSFQAALQLMEAFSGYKRYLTPAGVKELDTLTAEEGQYFQSQLSTYLAAHPDIDRSLQRGAKPPDTE
jgi:hypothetical protein